MMTITDTAPAVSDLAANGWKQGMNIVCRRGPNGRFVVESGGGDVFEYQVATRNGRNRIRQVRPPIWRAGPWPPDADDIADAARAAAVERARLDGFAI